MSEKPAAKYRVGQSVCVAYGGKQVEDATITKVGRKYGLALWGNRLGQSCEFVLSTGRERDEQGCKFANGQGHVVYVRRSDYEAAQRQAKAIDELATSFCVTTWHARRLNLSSECIDELNSVIVKHKGGKISGVNHAKSR
jgi:RecJ-like exonuclease